MSAGSILRSCFYQINQQLRFVFLDLVWRFVWLLGSSIAAVIFGFSVIAQLQSVEWKGPELGASNPIMLVTALREFWSAYGATLVGQLGLLVLSMVFFWIVLEALFRGGRQGFWVYFGTSVGRLSLLTGASVFFALLAVRDETGGSFLIGAIVILGLWFLVSVLETVIRKDALSLIAVEFPTLLAVFGTLMATEMFLAFVLWGSAVAAVKGSSNSPAGIAALVIVAVVAPFWMVLHSYVIALRFSAIDIIRNAVGE